MSAKNRNKISWYFLEITRIALNKDWKRVMLSGESRLTLFHNNAQCAMFFKMVIKLLRSIQSGGRSWYSG